MGLMPRKHTPRRWAALVAAVFAAYAALLVLLLWAAREAPGGRSQRRFHPSHLMR